MPQTYIAKRTSTPDSVSGNILATIVSQQDATISLPFGICASNCIGEKPSPHRSGIAVADTTTDLSTGSTFAVGRQALNNDAWLLAWGECTISSGTVTVVPVFFDLYGRPLFEGTSFTLASTVRQVQNLGNFVSRLHDRIPNPGTSAVKLYVLALTGTWNLYLASI